MAKRQVGNFPQAFSHVSLVNTAYNLSGTSRRGERRRRPACRHGPLGRGSGAGGGARGPVQGAAVGESKSPESRRRPAPQAITTRSAQDPAARSQEMSQA